MRAPDDHRVDGDGPDRDRRALSMMALARGVEIAARRQVHHGVGACQRTAQSELLDLFRGCRSRSAMPPCWHSPWCGSRGRSPWGRGPWPRWTRGWPGSPCVPPPLRRAPARVSGAARVRPLVASPGVTWPSLACSSCVTGSKPSGAVQLPSAERFQPGGMKSQALRSETGGIPGVSGELNARGPPICGGRAKLPGVVPSPVVEGLLPRGGSA